MVNVDTERTIGLVMANVERTVKRVAFEIANELKRTTPVDTGWARANWLASVGSPIDMPSGSREAVNTAAQAAGEARLLVYRFNQGNIYISNNVPYIQALNEGHSKQAPAGFVEAAIDRAVRTITGGGAA